MERADTGVPGLDGLIGGGIPRGHVVLISGQAGSGKTILGIQYLVHGARERNERGLLVTFEQSRESVAKQAANFGWDLEALVSEGKLGIMSFFSVRMPAYRMLEEVDDEIARLKPARMVLDSLSSFSIHLDLMTGVELMEMLQMDPETPTEVPSGEAVTRRGIMELVARLKSTGLTALVISELPEESAFLSRDTVSEHITDGVILLRATTLGDTLHRTLEVRKLRRSGIQGGLRDLEITPNGLEVKL